MNVSCSSNENICEATITVTFLKQTTMKHDMKKFHLTQCKCRIWNLINLLVIRKSSMCFFCFCHSKYHKSIMAPLQCDFLEDVYFSCGHLILLPTYLSIHLRRRKFTLVIWNIIWLNFIWSKNMKGNRGNWPAQFKFLFFRILWSFLLSYGKVYSFPLFPVLELLVCLFVFQTILTLVANNKCLITFFCYIWKHKNILIITI